MAKHTRETDKRPAIQWYPGDWLKDKAVRVLSWAARGFWFDCLNLMAADGTYLLRGTADELAGMVGGHPALDCGKPVGNLCITQVIAELRASRVCNVHFSRGRITLVSRRLRREWRQRKSAADRQKRHRTAERNAHVTGESQENHSASSSSSSSSDCTPPPPCDRGAGASPLSEIRARVQRGEVTRAVIAGTVWRPALPSRGGGLVLHPPLESPAEPRELTRRSDLTGIEWR